jgi:hypothetical protein
MSAVGEERAPLKQCGEVMFGHSAQWAYPSQPNREHESFVLHDTFDDRANQACSPVLALRQTNSTHSALMAEHVPSETQLRASTKSGYLC